MSRLPADRRKPRLMNAREIPGVKSNTGQLPAREFPRLEITGGPHGKDARILIDGVAPSKMHRVELAVDVKDVVRATVYQYVEVTVDVEAPSLVDGGYVVEVRAPDVSEGAIRAWDTIASAKGQSLREALIALADAVPADFEIPRPDWERRIPSDPPLPEVH